MKDWNNLLLVHGAEVLGRDLADDQVDDIAALEQPAPTVTAEDVENDEVVVNDGADEVLATRQATDPGSIEIRDPVTGEWFEIEAASCPPSWRPVALRETRQRELWDHPP